jgi:transmembrane sensor
MDNSRLEFLFKRYLDGRTTTQEAEELIQHITDNDNRQVKALLDELWNNPTEKLSADNAERILNSIISEQNNITSFHRKQRIRHWLKVAATVSIVALSSAVLYATFTLSKDISKPQHTAASTVEHQQITLPDGSTVILNTSSKLEYPDSFSDRATRTVRLRGEGFFNIVHDADKPFVVQAGTLTTTVLGTAFNVKAYPEENDITITVTRGKVKVSAASVLLGVLNPDEQITFYKANRHTKQQTVESREAISWSESDIFFDDIAIDDAARQLEQRFRVKIHFANDQIKTCRFTATFVSGEDLEQILKVICEFNGVTFSKGPEGEIEIDGTGCSR